MAKQRRQIELKEPGTFLMPQLFRFENFHNQPERALVWARASSPEGARFLLRLSHTCCASLLKFESGDWPLLERNLDGTMVNPETKEEVLFPLLSDYKGMVNVDESGYLLEFSGERSNQRIVIPMSSFAYKGLLSRLKKLFSRSRR